MNGIEERIHQSRLAPRVISIPLRKRLLRTISPTNGIYIMPPKSSGSSVMLRPFPVPGIGIPAHTPCSISPLENILTLAVVNLSDNDVSVKVLHQYPHQISKQDVAVPAGGVTYFDDVVYSLGPTEEWHGPTRTYGYEVHTGSGFPDGVDLLASLQLVEPNASTALADPVNYPPVTGERVFPSQSFYVKTGSIYHSFFNYASVSLRPPGLRQSPLPAEFGCVSMWNDKLRSRGDTIQDPVNQCLPLIPFLPGIEPGFYLAVPMTLKYHYWSNDGFLFPNGVPFTGNMLVDPLAKVFDTDDHTDYGVLA